MILVQHHAVADDDGRTGGAKSILEGTHATPPQQLAIPVVAKETARSKEADDPLPVRRRAGLGVASVTVDFLQLPVVRFDLPQHLAGVPLQSQGIERLILDTRYIDAIAVDHRGGVPGGRGTFQTRFRAGPMEAGSL